jgi:predicted nucleic acid-binding protein
VLDSEGLAKAVLRAREVTQWLALARADDLRVITSAATVVEVAHPRLNRPALEWTLSRVVVEPVTEPIARRATAILAEAGLHGHRHAIDAMLSATALAAPGPVTVLTSDPEDIATLCGRNVTVIKVLRGGPGNLTRGQTSSRRIRVGWVECFGALRSLAGNGHSEVPPPQHLLCQGVVADNVVWQVFRVPVLGCPVRFGQACAEVAEVVLELGEEEYTTLREDAAPCQARSRRTIRA